MNINEKAVEKLATTQKRLQTMDDETTGFGVRVESRSAGGRKSFFWCAKVDGDVYFKSLGEWPVSSVKDARDRAKTWAGKAAKWKQDGCPEEQNPFAKPKKQACTTTPLFKELAESYIQHHVRQQALNPIRAEYDIRLLVKNYLESWLDIPLDKITVDHVLAAKNSCEGRYMQNSIVEFAGRVFNWSVGKKDGKLNFWKVADNPAKDVALNDREKRQRFLQADELVRFHEELKKEPHADTRDVLALLLATGARKSNVYEMAWSDVSFELKNWRVPMSKSGEGFDVALTPAAVEVLERRRRQISESERYVFPAQSRSGHISDIKKRWQLFRKRAGIPKVRLHDIRRTKGSWASISGESLQKIAGILGHKSLGSTQIYARLNQESVRQASMASDAKMEEMMRQAKKRLKAATPRAPKAKLLTAVARTPGSG